MYSTEGIILKKIDVGEADALVSIYTKDYGKIRARAQGVKKPGAKLKGHLETLNHVWIGFVLGRNGERLTHAALLNPWLGIRPDLAKLGLARYLVELVDRHCLEGERDPALWALLLDHLSRLDQEVSAAAGGGKQFLRGFEAGFLASLGYAGEEDLRILGTTVPKPFPGLYNGQ